jgi:Zn-finger nucleic acid-binding protein
VWRVKVVWSRSTSRVAGTEFRVPYRDQKMACPGCQSPLSRVVWLNVARYPCRACSGIWLPREELGQLAREAGLAYSALDCPGEGNPSIRLCPQCGEPMREHGALADLPGLVRVDACDQHGVFYNDGELATILARLLEDEAKRRG